MRWVLIALYLTAAVLLVYGAFWEGGKETRFEEMNLGGLAVIAACGIDQASKTRIARSRSYTSTDWLRFWLYLLCGFCWTALFALDPPFDRSRHIVRTLVLAAYVLLSGLDLIQKPHVRAAGSQ